MVYRSHGKRLSKSRVHASEYAARRATFPDPIRTDVRAVFSRSLPRPSSRHFPFTSPAAVVASRVTSTAHRSPWMYGPAIVFGLRLHLSRKSFAFLTHTGGPSWREARGSDSTSSSNRNTASFPTTSKRESNTWKAFRWSSSAKDRWALRSCGYRTSSVTVGAGIEDHERFREGPRRRTIELEDRRGPPGEAVL